MQQLPARSEDREYGHHNHHDIRFGEDDDDYSKARVDNPFHLDHAHLDDHCIGI